MYHVQQSYRVFWNRHSVAHIQAFSGLFTYKVRPCWGDPNRTESVLNRNCFIYALLFGSIPVPVYKKACGFTAGQSSLQILYRTPQILFRRALVQIAKDLK